MYYLFGYLSFLIWPVIIIVAIIWAVSHVRSRGRKAAIATGNADSVEKHMTSQLAVSREDGLSQSLLVLGVIFIGVTLYAFNRDLGDPVGWRWIVFVTAVIAIAGAYWQRAAGLLLIGIAGFVCWFSSVLYLWTDAKQLAGIGSFVALSFLAILFFTMGRLHETLANMKRFALIYSGLGLLYITGTLFWISTQYGIDFLQEMTKGMPFTASWQLATLLFVLAIAVLGTTFASFGKKMFLAWEVVAVVLLLVLFGSTLLIPSGTLLVSGSYYGSNGLTDVGIAWAAVFNVAIFAELIALTFAGYSRKEVWMVNLGTFCMFLLIFVKYFDWFFSSLLDKSIFFIGAGILLFGLGWGMEKGRRYTLRSMKSQPSAQLPQ